MSARNYSRDIANMIHDFLVDDNWKFSFDEERGVFKFGLTLKGKLKSIDYRVLIGTTSYVVNAISPMGADKDNSDEMLAMADFICRANYGLRNGNFELDMRDGEVGYKSFVDCDNLVPSTEVIRNSIYAPAAMFTRYAPGILAVSLTGANGQDAIELCED